MYVHKSAVHHQYCKPVKVPCTNMYYCSCIVHTDRVPLASKLTVKEYSPVRSGWIMMIVVDDFVHCTIKHIWFQIIYSTKDFK